VVRKSSHQHASMRSFPGWCSVGDRHFQTRYPNPTMPPTHCRSGLESKRRICTSTRPTFCHHYFLVFQIATGNRCYVVWNSKIGSQLCQVKWIFVVFMFLQEVPPKFATLMRVSMLEIARGTRRAGYLQFAASRRQLFANLTKLSGEARRVIVTVR
jgi:hypothetical protein